MGGDNEGCAFWRWREYERKAMAFSNCARQGEAEPGTMLAFGRSGRAIATAAETIKNRLAVSLGNARAII